jgi:hemerythrin
MVWSAEYGVNVANFDNQHQRLLVLIGQLDESIAKGNGAFMVGRQFRSLKDYARYHFGYEEELMERCGYVELDRHRNSHGLLLQQLSDLERDYESANLGVGVALGDLFGHWLLDHIMTEDKKCGKFLNGLGYR